MSLRDQAKTSLPLVIRKSFSQTNQLEFEREQFEREQLNAVTKALSIIESPVKEKHVRTIIIGTFRQKSSNFMWSMVSSKAPLHGNPIVCWKFCSVLHKILREGHPRSVPEAIRHSGLLEDLGKLWGHLKEGYGRLISLYAKLLVRKLNFHEKHPIFPGNLAMEKENLLKAGNNDAGNFYELCIELLDYLEDIINLQAGVFDSLDMSKSNSMTSSGQCRLGPLIVCIQDSVHLYDFSVKIIFLLHQHLPPDTLSGHTARFLLLFNKLRKFYTTCSNLQYFKNLVQVPDLPNSPPNFLVASEIGLHVTPVAVVPQQPEEESEFDSVSVQNESEVRDERDSYIDQLLSEVESLHARITELEQEKKILGVHLARTQEQVAEESAAAQRLRAEITAAQGEIGALTAMMQQQQQLAEQDERSKSLEEKFNKLKDVYQKLREEHIQLLRKKAEVEKQLATSNITSEEAVKSKESMEKKLSELLTEVSRTREDLSNSRQEQDVQVHNLQASLGSLQSKLAAGEEEMKRREAKEKEVEALLLERDNNLAQIKLKLSDAEQNKHNLEAELMDLTAKVKTLSTADQGQQEIISVLEGKVTKQSEEILSLKSEAAHHQDLAESMYRNATVAARELLRGVANVEDIDSISSSGGTLLSVCRIALDSLVPDWPSDRSQQVGLIMRTCHTLCLAWGLSRGVANTCPDLDISSRLVDLSDSLRTKGMHFYEVLPSQQNSSETKENIVEIRDIINNIILETEKSETAKGKELDLATLVSQEIAAMDQAIEEAAKRIEELLAASRAKDTGQKLELNEKVLDSCTSLVNAIRELVNKSKAMQREIIAEGRGASGSDKDFYKKNSRWTEGLISAAKAVGLGAKLLMDAADKVVTGDGRFEEIMAASHEISGSTAQLVIASRVKARDGSSSFTSLKDASKVVTQATAAVVAVAKSCTSRAEDVELDFSKMSAHQTKTLEMEAQVKLIQLEQEVEVARLKLAALRRNNYKTGQDGLGE